MEELNILSKPINDSINTLESMNTVEFDFDIFIPNSSLELPSIKCGAGTMVDDGIYEQFDESVSFEFQKEISKADRLDYIVSACCGIITSALDILFIKDFSLEDSHNWGKDKTEEFVKAVARLKTDFRGDDLAKAVEALEKAFPIPADELTNDFGGGYWHHLRDFGHHPTLIGLCFSIISQLTGYGFGTDKDGNFVSYKVSDEFRGNNFPERIAKGTIDWLFHMISDMAGSSGRIRMGKEGTGLPGPLVSLLKELSALPLVKEYTVNYKENRITLSKWISKLFSGTLLARYDENGKIIKGTELRFDLRTEMGIGAYITKSAVPVIVNECIVRAFYMLRHIFDEVKCHEIKHIKDLSRINPSAILPVNNRTLSRMITVSSGVFMVIVTSKDAATALIKSKGNKRKFATHFLLNINYFGVMRFAFACKSDASYIAEDIKTTYRAYVSEKKRKAMDRNFDIPGLESLMLNQRQTRILYSLKRNKILYDIAGTKKDDSKAQKREWLNRWQNEIADELSNDIEALFIRTENEIKEEIEEELVINGCKWLYLIAIELNNFTPYYMLEENEENTKLKLNTDFEVDIFCKLQPVIDADSMSEIRKTYNRYESYITGKKAKRLAGAGATVVVTAATGGLALAFASEIAVTLVGSSFAGLSGAALTSASLAAIGGGSITAGGLGMAGGTAIIAGGGTLLGVVGSGSIALSASALLSSKKATLEECSKLLTFCKLGLKDDPIMISKIKESIKVSIENINNQIVELEKTKKHDKANLKNLKASIKYLCKCKDKLNKMI